MKKVISLLLIMAMCLTLAGCVRINAQITVSDDDSITINALVGYDKAAIDALSSNSDDGIDAISDLPVKEIDGRQYYYHETSETYTKEKLAKECPYMTFSSTGFYCDLSTQLDSQSSTAEESSSVSLNKDLSNVYDVVQYSVAFQHNVSDTNGEARGNKAVWNVTDFAKKQVLWAYTGKKNLTSDADTVRDQIAVFPETDTKPVDNPGFSTTKVIVGCTITYGMKKGEKFTLSTSKARKVKVLHGKKLISLKKIKYGKFTSYSTTLSKGKYVVTIMKKSGKKWKNAKKITFKVK